MNIEYSKVRSTVVSVIVIAFLSSEHYLIIDFWPTVLSVEPMVQYVVCLSVVCLSVCLSVCNVLYRGKTVRPSQKVSEGVCQAMWMYLNRGGVDAALLPIVIDFLDSWLDSWRACVGEF